MLEGRSTEVRCDACGAIVLLEDKVERENCPYCARHLDNQPEAAHGMLRPQGVLPFAITSKQACAAFESWLAERWFAPNSLRKFALLGQLSGVYLPFWTFDSMTYTAYQGERGDNYTVTVYRRRQAAHRWSTSAGPTSPARCRSSSTTC